MNEYRQELEAVVRSPFFRTRKARWDRVYSLYQQRGPGPMLANQCMVLYALHGSLDTLAVRLLRLAELLVSGSDLLLLSGLGFGLRQLVSYSPGLY